MWRERQWFAGAVSLQVLLWLAPPETFLVLVRSGQNCLTCLYLLLLRCEMGIRMFYLYLCSTENHGTIWFGRDLWKSLPNLLHRARPTLKLDPASGLDEGAQGCHRFCLVCETSCIRLWVRGRGLGEPVGQGLLHVSP